LFSECEDEAEGKALFRRLAKLLHPDMGGDNELMALLKNAHENFKISMLTPNSKAYRKPPKYQKKQKYNKVYEEVFIDDPEIKIIEDIFEYAKNHKKFNISYVSSIKDFLNENGYVTEGQYNGLVRIYTSFRMGD